MNNFYLMRFVSLICTCLNCIILSGCIVTHIDEEFQDPTFSWDTLKRDQILMMPLQDLRERLSVDPAQEAYFAFFSEAERREYPEKFKQVFFKNRKDIRVFGAGGAYEALQSTPNLNEKSKQILAKTPLSEQSLAEMKNGTQDIRFFMAFAVTKEELSKKFTYEEAAKKRYASKIYTAKRDLTVTMAIWDAKENKTVWVATKKITPQNTKIFRVPRRTKPDDDADTAPVTFDAYDSPYNGWTFDSEIAMHPERFPSYPGREPDFSNSFKDFSLALPLHPSEEKYIEYESFTYHRPEATLRASRFGQGGQRHFELGSSSIIHNRYRIGPYIGIPLNAAKTSFQNMDYEVSMFLIGLTLDAEFEWTKTKRLLIGSNIATGVLSASQDQSRDTTHSNSSNQEDNTISDRVGIYTPHVKIMFGDRQGGSIGLGVSYRIFSGIQEEIFKEQSPSNWSVEGSVAYTFRGF